MFCCNPGLLLVKLYGMCRQHVLQSRFVPAWWKRHYKKWHSGLKDQSTFLFMFCQRCAWRRCASERITTPTAVFSRTEKHAGSWWTAACLAHVSVCVCVFAEMQREHQRREHRLQEAHCCALSTMEEARQHQIRVRHTHTHTSCSQTGRRWVAFKGGKSFRCFNVVSLNLTALFLLQI